MCIGIPGKVIKIRGNKAKLKFPDHEHWVNITPLGDKVKIGEFLQTYQNVAIGRVSAEQARESIDLLRDYINCQK